VALLAPADRAGFSPPKASRLYALPNKRPPRRVGFAEGPAEGVARIFGRPFGAKTGSTILRRGVSRNHPSGAPRLLARPTGSSPARWPRPRACRRSTSRITSPAGARVFQLQGGGAAMGRADNRQETGDQACSPVKCPSNLHNTGHTVLAASGVCVTIAGGFC